MAKRLKKNDVRAANTALKDMKDQNLFTFIADGIQKFNVYKKLKNATDGTK